MLETILNEFRKVQVELAQLRAEVAFLKGNPVATEVVLAKAWKLLGYKNSKALWAQIDSGHYRNGIEAIDRRKPGATKAVWYLDLDACRQRDRQRASLRG